MKMKDLHELTKDELLQQHEELWRKLFGMRIKHALGQLENPLELRATRRGIARVRTLLHQQGVTEVPRRRRLAAPGSRAVTAKRGKASPAPAKGAAREVAEAAGSGAANQD